MSSETSTQVPSHYKALVYDQPGKISTKIETLETPKPGMGEVLINLTHSGVCHSDMGVMMQSWETLPFPTQAGQVGGHEGVGHIVAFGPGTEDTGLKLGQRVGVKWIATICRSCLPCISGFDGCCTNYKISGYYHPGTFQQYLVSSAFYVTPIPDAVPSDLAAPLLCGGVTVYSALKKSGAEPGDAVIIAGSGGGLGHLGLQIGKAMGFRMIGLDAGIKRDISIDCGAEAFFDVTSYPQTEEGTAKLTTDVHAVTPNGEGAAAVIVCTASNAAYAQGLPLLRWRGTLVCVGVPEGKRVPIASAMPMSLILGEKRVVGSALGNRRDAIETLEMAARGVVKTRFTVEPMSKLNDVFERMEKGELLGRVVLDLSKE